MSKKKVEPKQRSMNRRTFVRLLATGSAAVAAGAVPRLSGASAAHPAPGDAARLPSPAVRTELRNQERSLAKTLEVLRKAELPPGSPPAFVFKPLRATRRR